MAIPVLRRYQSEVLREILQNFTAGHRRLIAQMPTGSGKTVLTSELVRRLSARRVLYIVPSNEIFDQTLDSLEAVGLRPVTLRAGENPKLRSTGQVVLAMAATLANRIRDGWFDAWMPDLVITDECHRLLDQHIAVLRFFSAARSIGLTATPVRLDGRSLAAVWPVLVEGPSVPQLQAEGYLVPSVTLELPLVNVRGIKIRAGDYDVGQLSKAYENSRAADLAAIYWAQHASRRPTIAFCPSRKVSETLAEAARTLGARAEHLDGSTRPAVRDAVLERFEDGEIDLVSNCGLFVEGLDIRRVSCVVVCTSTLSLTKWLQMVGRGMRPFKGKRDLLVIDHGLCRRRLGDPSAVRDWTMGGMPIPS